MKRTITALEIQKGNKERVNVYLDGEFAFGLPIMEAARLKKGQTLSPTEIEALRTVDVVSQAYDHAVRLLARRPYSRAEIRRNLAAKQYPPHVIDEVLAKLGERGYVDDRAFARYWIENRERFKPRGPKALRYELRRKGIADAIIEEALSGLDPLDSARRAAQQRARRLRGLSRRDARQKLGQYLARRGFGYDTIRDVVTEILNDLNDEQPDYFAIDDTMNEE